MTQIGSGKISYRSLDFFNDFCLLSQDRFHRFVSFLITQWQVVRGKGYGERESKSVVYSEFKIKFGKFFTVLNSMSLDINGILRFNR